MIAEISAASSEQSAGIGSVNASVTQLDQMTQQNAALVEQSAAAAESLKEQSLRLAGAVSKFSTEESTRAAVHAAPVAPARSAAPPQVRPLKPAPAPKAAVRRAAAISVASAPVAVAAETASGDWETF
jgi:hypothetical protein